MPEDSPKGIGANWTARISVAVLTGGSDGSVSDSLIDKALLVAATEKRTRVEIDGFVAALGKVVR